MSKKTITLTEKDAHEITEDIRENMVIEVHIEDGGPTEEFEKKWENTEVPKLIEKLYDEMDYSGEDELFSAYIDGQIRSFEEWLVGKEVEVEEEVLA